MIIFENIRGTLSVPPHMGQLKKMAQMKSTKPCSEEECCGEGTTYVNGKCEKVTDIKETWAYAKKKKKGKR